MLHARTARFDVTGTVALFEKTFRELNKGIIVVVSALVQVRYWLPTPSSARLICPRSVYSNSGGSAHHPQFVQCVRISAKMAPSWALFSLHPNSKFFHSLFITSIFGYMHGALNVGKKNN